MPHTHTVLINSYGAVYVPLLKFGADASVRSYVLDRKRLLAEAITCGLYELAPGWRALPDREVSVMIITDAIQVATLAKLVPPTPAAYEVV